MSYKERLIFSLILSTLALLVFFILGATGHELENVMPFTVSLGVIIILTVILLRNTNKGRRKNAVTKTTNINKTRKKHEKTDRSR